MRNYHHFSTEVTCPVPSAPANGQVSQSGNRFGDVVTFKCNVGYNLNGSETRTCQADGFWSGKQPSCESKLHYNKKNYTSFRICK